MNDLQRKAIPGFLFACTSALTFLAYKTLWASEWYWIFLSVLGVLSAALAAKILMRTGLKFWPVAGVTVGLLFGQWWLLQTIILQTIWRTNGLAP